MGRDSQGYEVEGRFTKLIVVSCQTHRWSRSSEVGGRPTPSARKNRRQPKFIRHKHFPKQRTKPGKKLRRNSRFSHQVGKRLEESPYWSVFRFFKRGH